jgi:hypothetical protein
MGNDVVLNPMAGGSPVATDEIGGRHYQWLKIGYGGEDAFTPVDPAAPLPVTPDASGVPGSAPPARALVVAGFDGADVQRLKTDAAGGLELRADAQGGTAAPDRAVQAGGSDGANVQALKVDSGGRLELRSNGTAGGAVPDRVQQVGGKDGSGNLQPFKVNAAGNQVVDHSVSGIGSGRKLVTTAGTPVAISAAATAKGAYVSALDSNVGVVVFGDNAVVAASGTRRGAVLHPGDTVFVPCDDLSDIYIDAENSGEGVSFTSAT